MFQNKEKSSLKKNIIKNSKTLDNIKKHHGKKGAGQEGASQTSNKKLRNSFDVSVEFKMQKTHVIWNQEQLNLASATRKKYVRFYRLLVRGWGRDMTFRSFKTNLQF